MKQAEKYLKEGVDLTIFNLKEITFEDLEQLVLDTYNDAYHETVKNLALSGVGNPLKDEKRPTFEFWCDVNNIVNDYDCYFYKGDQVSIEYLVEKYVIETDNL